ncbi:Uncharacterised protein [Candidatus Tiddalikarchaeum anstoanum]|nr:Uncharacterised protein [Candidatus Tiddalikarchaeum anstoanum]
MTGFFRNIWKKWHLAVELTPLLILVITLKILSHLLGFEIISFNALFSSIIAASTFLIGFLISGVISDYKESEKLPGDLASSMEILFDEAYILDKKYKSKLSKSFYNFLVQFLDSFKRWFNKKEKTLKLFDTLKKMNDYFLELENTASPASISRMKLEQHNIRKMITRIHTIRETSFVPSAYTIVEVLAIMLISALIFLKLEPFYESIFFVSLVSFIDLYMLVLIKDLDNPFEYPDSGETKTEVSLKPLYDLAERVKHQ